MLFIGINVTRSLSDKVFLDPSVINIPTGEEWFVEPYELCIKIDSDVYLMILLSIIFHSCERICQEASQPLTGESRRGQPCCRTRFAAR